MARKIIGIVVSDKADKTIVLAVHERKTHPIYKKQYSRTVKHISHDENNEAKVGDKVEVKEVRPISARKSLTLVRVIEKAAISENHSVNAITAKDEGSEAKVQIAKELNKKEKDEAKDRETNNQLPDKTVEADSQ